MTLRDMTTAACGSVLSFGLSLATINDPPGFLRWGFFVSLTALVLLLLAEGFHRPWFSLTAIPTLEMQDGIVVQLGLRNHGRRQADRRIYNVLVPDHLAMGQCKFDGSPNPEREILHTPERVDRIHESDYWQKSVSPAPGTFLLHLKIALPPKGCPIRAQLGNQRRDLFVGTELNRPFRTHFAPIRGTLYFTACRTRRLFRQ